MRILYSPDTAVAPAPAAPAAPAPSTPAPAAPTSSPSAPVSRPRPTVSAAKALGLPEAPSKSVSSLLKDQGQRSTNASSNLPPSPSRAPDGKFVSTPAIPAPNPAPLADPTLTTPPAPAAAPAVPAVPAVPAAPAAPDPRDEQLARMQKTLEELQAKVAPTQPPAPVAPPPPAETAEQRVEREKQTRAAEMTWIEDRASHVAVPELLPEQMDAILSGGPDAVKMLTEIRRKDVAAATLEARKSIYEDINPLLDRIQSENAILMENHMALEQHRVEQQFLAVYPDLTPQIDTCRSVAQGLMRKFPRECQAMTREQFIAEVARQSNHVLDTRARQFGYENWKALPVAQQVPPAAQPTQQQVPPAPGAPATPAAPVTPTPVTPAVPAPRPPVSHAPTGPGGARAPKSWQQGIAVSLREP